MWLQEHIDSTLHQPQKSILINHRELAGWIDLHMIGQMLDELIGTWELLSLVERILLPLLLELVKALGQDLLVWNPDHFTDPVAHIIGALTEDWGAVSPPMLECLLFFPQILFIFFVKLLHFLLMLQFMFLTFSNLFNSLPLNSHPVVVSDVLLNFFRFLNFFLFMVSTHPQSAIWADKGCVADPTFYLGNVLLPFGHQVLRLLCDIEAFGCVKKFWHRDHLHVVSS